MDAATELINNLGQGLLGIIGSLDSSEAASAISAASADGFGSLSSLESLGPLGAGIALLAVLIKALSMPFKLIWNGICGAVMLWIINLIGASAGFGLKITVAKALIAGFFGVPGALAVVLYEIFGK